MAGLGSQPSQSTTAMQYSCGAVVTWGFSEIIFWVEYGREPKSHVNKEPAYSRDIRHGAAGAPREGTL